MHLRHSFKKPALVQPSGVGTIFAITGYINPSSGSLLPNQPEEAVLAIRWFASIIPAALLLFSIFFAWNYSITRESHKETLEQLEEKAGKGKN